MIKQNMFRSFKVSYHRNGCCGEPFYFCQFKFIDGKQFLDLQAVVFDTPGHVAVTGYGLNGRFRGDHFEAALRDAIAAVQRAQPESMHIHA